MFCVTDFQDSSSSTCLSQHGTRVELSYIEHILRDQFYTLLNTTLLIEAHLYGPEDFKLIGVKCL